MKSMAKMNLSKKNMGRSSVYTLEVFLVSGPLSKEFVKRNPIVSRTIEIRGDQTLEELHRTIFKAFDRTDEHMYEFQIGGKGPNDPKAKRYILPTKFDNSFKDSPVAGNPKAPTIDSVGLCIDDAFGYNFDFGDDWWHQINVVSIREATPNGFYPKLTGRTGESPPQYSDIEDDE